MSWREDLRRVEVTIDGQKRNLIGARFRGVAFFVDGSELSTGRRLVVHEFPLRNNPFVEDMGRRARKFRIDGYVIGDDYLAQKTALIGALETEGPGQLLHPYYGLLRGGCETASVRETRAEGGWAQFAIEFIETPAQAPTPTIEVDNAGKVSTSADAASKAADAQLAADYDASGLPAFALTTVENAIRTAADFLGDKLAPAVAHAQELASFNGQLTLIAARASSFAQQPANLLQQVRDAIGSIVTTIATEPGEVYDALVAAYSAALETPVIGGTETRRREAANQAAMVAALRSTIAIEAARLAPLVPFPSIEDATAARDRLVALLDEQAQLAGDTAYPALVALRADVMRAVPGSAVSARVVTVTRRAAVPSLVLAYQLYGSVDKEADVIARNRDKSRHSGFMVGEIKVLSNDS